MGRPVSPFRLAYDPEVEADGLGSGVPRPEWGCCLPTTDETTISLSARAAPGPWAGARARTALQGTGDLTPDPDRERYAVGGGGGEPQLHGEPLLWLGIPIWLEVCAPAGELRLEVTLRLPPWHELSSLVGEDALWEAADILAKELGADLGTVDDGATVGFPDFKTEPTWARRVLHAHLGVIVPDSQLAALGGGFTPYRQLPRSHLLLVLR